jgi:hypothetical protein
MVTRLVNAITTTKNGGSIGSLYIEGAWSDAEDLWADKVYGQVHFDPADITQVYISRTAVAIDLKDGRTLWLRLARPDYEAIAKRNVK